LPSLFPPTAYARCSTDFQAVSTSAVVTAILASSAPGFQNRHARAVTAIAAPLRGHLHHAPALGVPSEVFSYFKREKNYEIDVWCPLYRGREPDKRNVAGGGKKGKHEFADLSHDLISEFLQNHCKTGYYTGVFNRELIGVAFHANSVDQAFKRTVDFRARVGKLAALRSADR
jgi:hypothetical protein